MSDNDELRNIWEQAVGNADDEDNYFYERTVMVDGVELEFNVDLTTAIYYTPCGSNGVDDLVYAKVAASKGASEQDIMDSYEEFKDRVESVTDEWESLLY